MSVKSFISINGKPYDLGLINREGAPDEFQDCWVIDDETKVVEVDWQKARELFREKAEMSNVEFALLAAGMGWITETEAEEWAARGVLPQMVRDKIEAFPEEDRFGMRMTVATRKVVHRNDGLLAALADEKNVSPEQLDAAFGYTGQ